MKKPKTTIHPVSVLPDERDLLMRLLGEARVRYKKRTAPIIIEALKLLLRRNK